MKKLTNILYLYFLFHAANLVAQNEIKIKDLEIPNAPALSLLDETTTILETPKNIKTLTSSIANGLGNNMAIEFSPYLLFSNNKSFYDYNGFKMINNEVENENEKKLVEKGLFGQIITNFSVSIASVKKDSLNNLSVGLRTNLLTIQNPKRIKVFSKAEKKYNEEIYKILVNEEPENLSNNPEYIKLTKEYNILLDSVASLNTKPLFSVDVAGGYSHVFTNNNYNSGTKGKVASWLTFSYNNEISTNSKGTSSYVSFYGIGRFIQDNNYYEESSNNIISKDFFDCGGKIEIDFGKLLFGYEYVSRLNEDNNYRSVGIIKYKISKDIVLNGGFGKNFENNQNLVSFLGINWGLDLDKNIFSKE
jgi:hypothetical protein